MFNGNEDRFLTDVGRKRVPRGVYHLKSWGKVIDGIVMKAGGIWELGKVQQQLGKGEEEARRVSQCWGRKYER